MTNPITSTEAIKLTEFLLYSARNRSPVFTMSASGKHSDGDDSYTLKKSSDRYDSADAEITLRGLWKGRKVNVTGHTEGSSFSFQSQDGLPVNIEGSLTDEGKIKELSGRVGENNVAGKTDDHGREEIQAWIVFGT